jgi:hypothetical protein
MHTQPAHQPVASPFDFSHDFEEIATCLEKWGSPRCTPEYRSNAVSSSQEIKAQEDVFLDLGHRNERIQASFPKDPP